MAHSLRSHYFHVIWSTKNRTSFIVPNMQDRLYRYISGVIHKHESIPIAIGGTSDHIHLLIAIKNCDQYSRLIKNIKTSSTHWIHKNFPEHKSFAWQEGYGSFTVSYSGLNQVRSYIHDQKKHHEHMSFEDEYLKILRHCQIKYDPRFVVG